MSPHSPIVVLDSGLGGLTVVRELRELLPHDDFLYFGDTARLPYGSKSPATVARFVRQIVRYLRPFDPKHVVVACNTASALALTELRGEFSDLHLSGVVEPGAKAAVRAAGARDFPVIGILATEATIRSKAYERAVHRRRHHARMLLQAAPLLAPIIEEGRSPDDPLVRLALKQYLKPMAKRGLDVLILGCTHYPILRPTIEAMLPKVAVIDSAKQCAQDVAARLAANGVMRTASEDESGGSLRLFVTDESPRFAKLASQFLGFEIDPPTLVSPDELYALDSETTSA